MTASGLVLNSPELLGKIFLRCLPDAEDDDNLPGYSPLEAPVVLTHVSKTWRGVALAYRLLWSRLSLCLWTSTFQSEDGLRFPCGILSEWLRRSSPLPFSLKITFEWDEAPLHCTCHMARDTSLDDILIEHCHRWEGLDIGLTSRLYRNFLQKLATLKFPELKRFMSSDYSHASKRPFYIQDAPKLETLFLVGEEYVSTNRYLVDDGLPPNLRTLMLEKVSLDLDGLRTTNITKLELYDAVISLDNFAKFPYFFPLLKELTLSYGKAEIEPGELHSSVVLRNLISLNTTTVYDFPFKYLTAPKLSHLQLDRAHSRSSGQLTFATVLSFLKRSSPRLLCFHNNGLLMTNDEFVTFLDRAPDLLKLDVTDTPISINMLHALAVPIELYRTVRLRCPKLYAFECNRVMATDRSSASLKTSRNAVIDDLVKNRCSADDGPLKDFGYPFQERHLERLMRLYQPLFPSLNLYSTLDSLDTQSVRTQFDLLSS